MKPTVGRIVHYTNLGDRDGKFPPEVQAAIITKVRPGLVMQQKAERGEDVSDDPKFYAVSLRIFYETGDFWMQEVLFTEAKAGSEEARGKWTWPERT